VDGIGFALVRGEVADESEDLWDVDRCRWTEVERVDLIGLNVRHSFRFRLKVWAQCRWAFQRAWLQNAQQATC